MEKIAIISDIHANITALETVLDDIRQRQISRVFCLGDLVSRCSSPDLVIDKVRENCEIVIKGNCDELMAADRAKERGYWTRNKIGEERADYLRNLPVCYEFYMSGRLIRLFHASPYGLSHIYNPMFSNLNNDRKELELSSAIQLFDNTEFIGKTPNDPTPDIVGYGHIHTPNVFRYNNKTVFNAGSVGFPIEMLNENNLNNQDNRFSTLASYAILEGEMDSKDLKPFSINIVRVPYDIEKEIEILKQSTIPYVEEIVRMLRTASPY